jgi:hypothetical protein
MTPIIPSIRFMIPEETRTARLIIAGCVIYFEGTTDTRRLLTTGHNLGE